MGLVLELERSRASSIKYAGCINNNGMLRLALVFQVSFQGLSDIVFENEAVRRSDI